MEIHLHLATRLLKHVLTTETYSNVVKQLALIPLVICFHLWSGERERERERERAIQRVRPRMRRLSGDKEEEVENEDL